MVSQNYTNLKDYSMTNKLLSICIVTLNDKDNLIKTLKSIQYSPDIEIIIQDGKSSYDIIKVLEQFENLSDIIRIQIDKDTGIYDAMNKAVERSNGKYVMFLNCGDLLARNTHNVMIEVLSKLDERFKCVKFFADVAGVGINIERASNLYFFKHMLNHQSIIYRREVFIHHKYDSNMKIAADLKHFLESDLLNNIAYMDLVLIEYMNGGAAAIKSGIKQNWKERSTSWRWNISIYQRCILMIAVIVRYFLYFFRLKK
jgi:glycosyltransferase involved in cell wall biosynthesis